MKHKYIIFSLIVNICLLGYLFYTPISALAEDDYEYSEDYDGGDEDEDSNTNSNYDYNFWTNYWKQFFENQSDNQPEEKQEGENQPVEEDEAKDETDNAPKLDMTNVTLDKTSLSKVVVDYGGWIENAEFKIKVNSETRLNQDENADVSAVSSNKDMYFYTDLVDNVLTISTSSAGKTTLKLTINEKVFEIKVNIKSIGLDENYYIVAKGKSEKISAKGLKGVELNWKSAKPDIAVVDKDGRIKGLKEGNAVITAKVDGTKLAFLVSVVPEIKKKAVKWAIEYSNKSEYSQPKRMQKGYYDCSSLVWRAYNKFGHNLAGAKYAPTAAELCRHYDSKKQYIKGGMNEKNLEGLKLMPGDLVFYSGEKNGRYKNIYHVEMVAGYNFYGLDEKGHPNVSIKYVRLGLGGGQNAARILAK